MGELGVELTVTVGDNLESTSLLIGGSLLLLGALLLAGVEVFESLSSGCFIRLLGFIDPVSDLDKLLIKVTKSGVHGILHSGSDSPLNKACGCRLDKLVEQVMLGVPDGELESINVDVNEVGLEDSVPTVLDRLKLDVNRDTLPSENNIGKTVVRKLGPSALTPKGKGNIPDVGLDLTETQSELVVLVVHRLVQLGVRAEREGVERLNMDKVREEVRTGKDQVLNNQIDAVVGVFSAGDGDIADLLEKHREQDLSNIVPKLGLESKVTFMVEEQVLAKSLDVVTKSDVERVLTKGSEPNLELIEKKLLVGLVLILEESSARLSKLPGLTVRVLVEDVTGL